MATNKISKIHHKHNEWMTKLKFIKDEIICLTDELDYMKAQIPTKAEYKDFGDFKLLLKREWQKVDNFIELIKINENYLAIRAQKGQHISIDSDPVTEKIQLFFLDFISVKEEVKRYIVENLKERKKIAI